MHVYQAVVAASMTDKSPFVAPLGKQDQVNAARHALAVANSDQLTIVNAFLGCVTLVFVMGSIGYT